MRLIIFLLLQILFFLKSISAARCPANLVNIVGMAFYQDSQVVTNDNGESFLFIPFTLSDIGVSTGRVIFSTTLSSEAIYACKITGTIYFYLQKDKKCKLDESTGTLIGYNNPVGTSKLVLCEHTPDKFYYNYFNSCELGGTLVYDVIRFN